ncbi:hypothetical protein EJB05_25180, partial [Eragrostis curvula]
MAPARSLSRPGSDAVVPLPSDAVYEVLLRVPGRDLCRFRAVCRPWHRLLSDPQFIAAHAARNSEPPLVVAGYHASYGGDGVLCDILALSGKVVRRVHAAGKDVVTSVNLDFVCTYKGYSSCIRLFNMTTGDVFALPEGLSDQEHAGERDILDHPSVAALGKVASTGEYKVLRVLNSPSIYNPAQLCQVFTLDGRSHARWRRKKAPPSPVSVICNESVAVNGIVYFLGLSPQENISSFDLEREEWRSGLQGPRYKQLCMNELSMAAMNGCLVLVRRYLACYVDLWFLVDFERGLWEKRHSIRAQIHDYTSAIRPLLVLNDGRIVLVHVGSDSGSLKIYNPRTNTYEDVADTGLCVAVGLYSGSLLSLANRQTMCSRWIATIRMLFKSLFSVSQRCTILMEVQFWTLLEELQGSCPVYNNITIGFASIDYEVSFELPRNSNSEETVEVTAFGELGVLSPRNWLP